MANQNKIKKVAISMAFICSVSFGIFIMYHVGMWLYHLHLIHELTGAICNFTMYLTIGLLFLFENIVEYSKAMFLASKKEFIFMIFSSFFLLVAVILLVVFLFTEEWLNFSVIFLLEIPGLFLIYLPRLIKAKKLMDIVKAEMEEENNQN